MVQHVQCFCAFLFVQPRRAATRPRHPHLKNASGVGPLRSIRMARIEDVEALEEQARAIDWNLAQLEEEQRRTACDNPRLCTFLVSEDSGAMQGFAIGWHVAGELQVMALAVSAKSRRRGIGQLLLRELLDISRRQGDFIAMLEVKASNHGALLMYSKLGFDEVGRRPRYYSDGEDALLLQKQL
ncbi:acyl-CoA N-acyltransferase [Coccomyxa subellipsoidea C-169]|uniref:Acyl-CoA N-acyltransferase n=1 Tax=Coccomyxa subellipsoidea (strain C-169) TaxID=574566 RepID=I0Z734_COCSC|nr:acyl-CoA N-acyltransferase [Coccomyxa subellipsoidea C-169]EIE26453.1 acyl-CoA N-acyltransferase [Coccomyxa subellipsoidea C-169]|eukprot:XP_005650997.1 acyl-CoA N-acyltransferase [Coccomyxa subellipsoidea C-169]